MGPEVATNHRPRVSLVIPGRDCAATLLPCLQAVTAILLRDGSPLGEILFVDDGSRDGSAELAAGFPVTVLRGAGRGAGAARNLGWRAARHELVWFVDSDCVASADALDGVLPELADPTVGAVGGSYDNAEESSLLAALIHEEIRERHLRMGREVDFLATFHVVYRRSVLAQLGGFDERFLKGQDAELAFRAREAGHRLRFVEGSRVAHFHETSWRQYLRTQRQQGHWRVFLHMERRGHAAGDSYSRLGDHLQPPVAVLGLAALPLACVDGLALAALAPWLLLAALQVPLTVRLLRRTGEPRMLAFAAMGAIRAVWRGVGMVGGVVAWWRAGRRAGGPRGRG